MWAAAWARAWRDCRCAVRRPVVGLVCQRRGRRELIRGPCGLTPGVSQDPGTSVGHAARLCCALAPPRITGSVALPLGSTNPICHSGARIVRPSHKGSSEWRTTGIVTTTSRHLISKENPISCQPMTNSAQGSMTVRNPVPPRAAPQRALPPTELPPDRGVNADVAGNPKAMAQAVEVK